ncbi:MAG: flagellar biosynthesis protein FliQ [Butyrivibrio sp.]|nr:flagellar biosynthesis protein FliQ [Muribaculum sp.]MCM1552030.1 flagellar biosynthesis protein FliQ [Butyrivibrio sp.]
MTVDAVTEMANNALFLILQVSLPVLLVSLIVGLLVSIFQTVTSIQEQTLTFVPKIISIFIALALIGGWMMTKMVDFTTQLWGDFTLYIHR